MNTTPLRAMLSLNRANGKLMEYYADILLLLVRDDMDADDMQQFHETIIAMKESAEQSKRIISMYDLLE